MEKIRVKELIEYRRCSDKRKKRFADNLKIKISGNQSTNANGGGDYWISSTSCIQNVLKTGDKGLYTKKIEELTSKLEDTNRQQSKQTYQRNIDILHRFLEFNLEELMPEVGYKSLSAPRSSQIVQVEGFPIYVNPKFIFSFDHNGEYVIGSIWLVTKLDGYSKWELGLFCEMLYKFLDQNHHQKYQISEKHCIVIETSKAEKIHYSDFSGGCIPFLIERTLQEIKSL